MIHNHVPTRIGVALCLASLAITGMLFDRYILACNYWAAAAAAVLGVALILFITALVHRYQALVDVQVQCLDSGQRAVHASQRELGRAFDEAQRLRLQLRAHEATIADYKAGKVPPL